MVVFLISVGVLGGALLGLRLFWKIHHMPAPPVIGRFLDSGWRRLFQPAEMILARSGVQPGMRVLELGSGSGAYTPFLARAVGKEGRVYAADIQQGMLRQLEKKLARPEYADVRTLVDIRQASAYELPFPEAFFDLVFLVTVLPEIPDRLRALREIRRVLKPGGVLADTEFLPDPDYPWRGTVIKLGRGAGLLPEASQGNFWNYTVRFRKPGSEAS